MTERIVKLVGVKKMYDDVQLPKYGDDTDAGADIRAYCPEGTITIEPGKRKLIHTGIIVEIPEGFEIQVRPRSGLALKKGLTVLNTPGTIDEKYRNEIGIILINLGDEDIIIEHQDRVAQLILTPVYHANYYEISSVTETDRGTGFGSSGIK